MTSVDNSIGQLTTLTNNKRSVEDEAELAASDDQNLGQAPAKPANIIPDGEHRKDMVTSTEARRRPLFGGSVADSQVRKVRGMLNRMVPSSVDSLSAQISDTCSQLDQSESSSRAEIVDVFVSKLTSEHQNAEMNLKVIKRLPDNFRRDCYTELTARCSSFSVNDVNADAVESIRQNMIANVKIIVELSKQGEISSSDVRQFAIDIKSDLRLDSMNAQQAIKLEILCLLLNALGKEVDHPVLSAIFDYLGELSTHGNTGHRLQFMAKELSELRKNNWSTEKKQVPITSQNNEIDEIIESFILKLRETSSELITDQAMKTLVQRLQPRHRASLIRAVNEIQSKTSPNPRLSRSPKRQSSIGDSGTDCFRSPFLDVISIIRNQPAASVTEQHGEQMEKNVCKISSLEQMKVVVVDILKKIYKKSSSDHSSADIYSNLCTRLAGVSPIFAQSLIRTCEEDEIIRRFHKHGSLQQYICLVYHLHGAKLIERDTVHRILRKLQDGLYEITDKAYIYYQELSNISA